MLIKQAFVGGITTMSLGAITWMTVTLINVDKEIETKPDLSDEKKILETEENKLTEVINKESVEKKKTSEKKEKETLKEKK